MYLTTPSKTVIYGATFFLVKNLSPRYMKNLQLSNRRKRILKYVLATGSTMLLIVVAESKLRAALLIAFTKGKAYIIYKLQRFFQKSHPPAEQTLTPNFKSKLITVGTVVAISIVASTVLQSNSVSQGLHIKVDETISNPRELQIGQNSVDSRNNNLFNSKSNTPLVDLAVKIGVRIILMAIFGTDPLLGVGASEVPLDPIFALPLCNAVPDGTDCLIDLDLNFDW